MAAEGEVALGIRRNEPDEHGRHILLNPPRGEYLDLKPGDGLVVLRSFPEFNTGLFGTFIWTGWA